MIVHILPPADGFPAVSYNTDKVDTNKGELMKVANFGALQGLMNVRPEDYKNHLAMVSATNKHVKRPQFHVVISAEGRTYDKYQLTAIAEEWLAQMGYEKQPYLIIFHKDTANNHIHLVTARIDHTGKKISDRFEKIRAVETLNRVLGIDARHSAKSDIENALAFRFATEAQFRMILESKGYILRERDRLYEVIKFGKLQETIGSILIIDRLTKDADQQRKIQLKAWFHKYAAVHNTALEKGRKGYQSEFAAIMKVKFGVELIFHASGDKLPYGYSVIDHSGKNVFKGGEIMPLKELLAIRVSESAAKENPRVRYENNGNQLNYYASLLKAAMYNYPDLTQGLQHQGLVIIKDENGFTLHDPAGGIFINTSELLNENQQQAMANHFGSEHLQRNHPAIPGINLASDVDDDAVLGMKRRRKKKARTNLR
ncbi:relaxase/mobilization nuclease domain-containing protein [Mucilaginibacter sabulilitoris]|uniref:Relaxase/mobilization nuclease domain-containing protein n=1 Tax=Mucilaginibacter sabulilitoris TaxID=1173583 RepID=A0ABZ0TUC3_9SPHI|nr:relaxase/mobilization nuclease domain-containing protein [Mucilaginibacter sabulilitoris]WPU96477.1 relaxase/mobilization nuclease domain-containing protein [Mucilaginibacter sabulilitoris]